MILIHPFAKKLPNNNPKNYPYWKELISKIDDKIIQIGIDGEEQLVDDFRKNLSLDEICKLIQECDTWIAVDSFFQHLAWREGKKGIVLWSQSDPLIFGHKENVNLLKDRKYLRPRQFDTWFNDKYIEEAFVSADEVIKQIQKYGK